MDKETLDLATLVPWLSLAVMAIVFVRYSQARALHWREAGRKEGAQDAAIAELQRKEESLQVELRREVDHIDKRLEDFESKRSSGDKTLHDKIDGLSLEIHAIRIMVAELTGAQKQSSHE